MNRAGCPSVGVGTSSGASSRAPARTRTGRARPRPVTGRPPSRTVTPPSGAGPAEPADGRGRDRTGERHPEGDRGRATERGEVDQRGVGLAERQSRPGEPPERGAAPQRLLGDPEQGDDERTDPGCPGQRRRALQQGGGPADQRDVEGLQHRQGQPRRLAHVDPGPREHRHEAGQAGDEAEQQTPPGRDVAGREGEQADADGGEEPLVVGGEREPQRQAGGEREDQAEAHRLRLCHPADGAGPACRWCQPCVDRMPTQGCCLLSTRALPSATRTPADRSRGRSCRGSGSTRRLRAQATLGPRTDPHPVTTGRMRRMVANSGQHTGPPVSVKRGSGHPAAPP